MYGFEHVGMGGGWMILIWLVPVVLIVLAIRYVVARDRDRKPERTALDILEGRYALGEIDRDEFLKRRDDLAG